MNQTKDLSDALIAAHLSGTRNEAQPATLERADILSIQSAVSAALGDVAGFKVAPIGEKPILAPIPARYVVANGGTRKIPDKLGVELEVGFEILKALPSGGLPDALTEYVRPVAALELVDTRLSGPAADDAAMKFADLQINAGLVTASPLTDWDGSDFGELEMRLTADDEVIVEGTASVPGGSALSNLQLLTEFLGDHCGGLQPGHIVITGSLCGLPYFGPGRTITGWIDGLGSVSVITE